MGGTCIFYFLHEHCSYMVGFVVCGYGKMMLFFCLNAFYFSFLIIAVVDEYSEVVFSIFSVLSVSSLN